MIVDPSAPGAMETASEYATMSVPVFAPDDSAGSAVGVMLGNEYESAADVAVCEGDRLVGLVTVEQLLAASGSTVLRDVMDDRPPVIHPGVDREVAAWRAVQHGESSLAVVDGEGRFHGLVPPRRLLAVLLHEHAEDFARLGGFLHDSESARAASAEPVGRRFRHRLPWLVVGLAGAMLAAGIVSSFESVLREEVLLTFFLPGIVYMADAIGTQTETLVIRGLSVGVPIGSVVRREALTGLAVGVCLAAGFFPVSLAIWGDADVSLAVSLALLAASSTATVVAMALPALIARAGRDPAFGSGPLATVIQDLLSILIYFIIASAIVS